MTARPSGEPGRDPIASWLEVFVRTSGLPPTEASGICDELEDHLRSRVDDLMVTGHSEAEALRRALDEFGTIAELGRRFRSVDHKKGRRLMVQASTVGMASAALLVGVFGLIQQPGGTGQPGMTSAGGGGGVGGPGEATGAPSGGGMPGGMTGEMAGGMAGLGGAGGMSGGMPGGMAGGGAGTNEPVDLSTLRLTADIPPGPIIDTLEAIAQQLGLRLEQTEVIASAKRTEQQDSAYGEFLAGLEKEDSYKRLAADLDAKFMAQVVTALREQARLVADEKAPALSAGMSLEDALALVDVRKLDWQARALVIDGALVIDEAKPLYKRTISTRTYDLSTTVRDGREFVGQGAFVVVAQMREVVSNALAAKMEPWVAQMQVVRVEVVGDSLAVTATPELHAVVAQVIADLERAAQSSRRQAADRVASRRAEILDRLDQNGEQLVQARLQNDPSRAMSGDPAARGAAGPGNDAVDVLPQLHRAAVRIEELEQERRRLFAILYQLEVGEPDPGEVGAETAAGALSGGR